MVLYFMLKQVKCDVLTGVTKKFEGALLANAGLASGPLDK